MLKSILKTQKLFTIEGLGQGQVDVKTSEYLLSLPEDEQMEVLTDHLNNLKTDLVQGEKPESPNPNGKNDDLDKAQLQVLIHVIEGLLSQI